MLSLTRGNAWEKVMGGFSRPGKMPGLAWGISAARCRIGSVLFEQDKDKADKQTVCGNCYARKGTYGFSNVQAKLEERYRALFDPRWVPAMVAGLRVNLEPGEKFRFFDSGDLQSEAHLRNILRICAAVRDVLMWMPSREHALVRSLKPSEVPENLVIRLSGNLIDGKPPMGWPTTSTVVSDIDEASCPSSIEGGSCDENECDACWSRDVKTVKYLRH